MTSYTEVPSANLQARGTMISAADVPMGMGDGNPACAVEVFLGLFVTAFLFARPWLAPAVGRIRTSWQYFALQTLVGDGPHAGQEGAALPVAWVETLRPSLMLTT